MTYTPREPGKWQPLSDAEVIWILAIAMATDLCVKAIALELALKARQTRVEQQPNGTEKGGS